MKAVLTNRSVKPTVQLARSPNDRPRGVAGLVARVLGHVHVGLTQLFPLYAPPATSRPASRCVRIWLIGRPSKTAVASTTEGGGGGLPGGLLSLLGRKAPPTTEATTTEASTTEAKGWERASVLLAFLLAIASGIAQYSMLQSEVKNVKELYSKLDSKLDSSLDKLDSKLDKLDSKLDKLESKLDKLESKLDNLESKLDMVFGLDKRVS